MLVSLCVLMLSACEPRQEDRSVDKQEIRTLLQKRAEVIANKDLQGYGALIMPEYQDVSINKAMLLEEMQHAFATYKQLSLDYQKSPVAFKMNSARAVQQITYMLDGRQVHEREILLLRKLNGQWYISGGIKTGLF